MYSKYRDRGVVIRVIQKLLKQLEVGTPSLLLNVVYVYFCLTRGLVRNFNPRVALYNMSKILRGANGTVCLIKLKNFVGAKT